MAIRELLRSRIALRIYLTGLAQIAVVAAGFFVILFLNRPERRVPMFVHAERAAEMLEPRARDPEALERELERISEEDEADIAVVDFEDHAYASSPGAESLRCPRLHDHHGRHRGGPRGPERGSRPLCAMVPILLPTGEGTLHYLGRPPPPPASIAPRVVPLVLIVVGIASLLLAWSLVRPLQRLSRAAKAFGSGDMSARVGLRSKNELGEVSRAFDEMAERVSIVLRSEKELLANVSHELRTPLARIRVALDLAAEGDAAVAREALTDIAGDLDELERLLADVLTVAKLDLAEGARHSGLPPLRRERIDPVQLIEAAAQRFRIAHPERRLEVEVPAELPSLDGDPVLLRRLVENLTSNAHKYTDDPNAPVRLAARAEDGVLVIDVTDEGVGINEADLPFIFRPFFRADRSRTRATGGLGLGLALAKRIADAHGGTIEIDSTPGRGTHATVRVPFGRAKQNPLADV